MKLLLVSAISVKSEHAPFVTVQRKVVVSPLGKSVNVEGLCKFPFPATTVQIPVPPKVEGSFPLRIKSPLH